MKNHHHNGSIHPTSRELIHEAIAARAYAIWLQAGEPDDQAAANWLQAEHELMTGRSAPATDPVLPVSF